jgi:citrate lyase subunit beta/citryl-CoA lyase
MSFHPRRSVLYMPGANARALEKARTLACDAVILDLEDAVAPDAKETARTQVMAAVQARGFGSREVIVRINGLDTTWWLDDLDAAARVHPDGILVPKISKPDDLLDVAERLVDIAADHHIRLWAMIETPHAIINATAIAATVKDVETRLAGFVMGTNDLARETRACRAVPRCCHGLPTRCSRPMPSASTSWTGSIATSPMPRAFAANADRAATWGLTARR